MTNNTEILRELVELRARNARLEQSVMLLKDYAEIVTVKLDSVEDLIGLGCLKTVSELTSETTPPGFADKVLKLAAAGRTLFICQGIDGTYREQAIINILAAVQKLTPEEAKLLEGFADA